MPWGRQVERGYIGYYITCLDTDQIKKTRGGAVRSRERTLISAKDEIRERVLNYANIISGINL